MDSDSLVWGFDILVSLHVDFQLATSVERQGTLGQGAHPTLWSLVQPQVSVQVVDGSEPTMAVAFGTLQNTDHG